MRFQAERTLTGDAGIAVAPALGVAASARVGAAVDAQVEQRLAHRIVDGGVLPIGDEVLSAAIVASFSMRSFSALRQCARVAQVAGSVLTLGTPLARDLQRLVSLAISVSICWSFIGPPPARPHGDIGENGRPYTRMNFTSLLVEAVEDRVQMPAPSS